MVRLGITDVIVLATKGEMRKYRTLQLLPRYDERNIHAHLFPLQDGTAPTFAQAKAIINQILNLITIDKRKVLMQ